MMTNVISAAPLRRRGIATSSRALSGSNRTAAITAQRIAPEKGATSHRKASVAPATSDSRNTRDGVMLSRLPSLTAQLPMRVSGEGETARTAEPVGIYRRSSAIKPV